MKETRNYETYFLKGHEDDRQAPHFASVHGKDALGHFGYKVAPYSISSILGSFYLKNLTVGPEGYGYDDLKDFFIKHQGFLERSQLAADQRQGSWFSLTAEHSTSAAAYIKPVFSEVELNNMSENKRKRLDKQISRANEIEISRFAINPRLAGYGLGSLLMHSILRGVSDEATVNIKVLGPNTNPLGAWLERMNFDNTDGGIVKLGDARVHETTFSFPGAGQIRQILSDTGRFERTASQLGQNAA